MTLQLFTIDHINTIIKISQDSLCEPLQTNFWYLDDRVLSVALSRAMEIIQGDSTITAYSSTSKSKLDLSMFYPGILCCSPPDFEILGAPCGSPLLCTAFIGKNSGRKPTNYSTFCLGYVTYVTLSLRLLFIGYVLHSTGWHI